MSIYLFLIMLLIAVSVVFTDPPTEETSTTGRIRKIKDRNIFQRFNFKSKLYSLKFFKFQSAQMTISGTGEDKNSEETIGNPGDVPISDVIPAHHQVQMKLIAVVFILILSSMRFYSIVYSLDTKSLNFLGDDLEYESSNEDQITDMIKEIGKQNDMSHVAFLIFDTYINEDLRL